MISARTAAFLVLAALVGGETARAQDEAQLQGLGDEAVQRLQEYLRVNTINPPGNESRGVEFFANILRREGIAYESAESAPGRGSLSMVRRRLRVLARMASFEKWPTR